MLIDDVDINNVFLSCHYGINVAHLVYGSVEEEDDRSLLWIKTPIVTVARVSRSNDFIEVLPSAKFLSFLNVINARFSAAHIHNGDVLKVKKANAIAKSDSLEHGQRISVLLRAQIFLDDRCESEGVLLSAGSRNHIQWCAVGILSILAS